MYDGDQFEHEGLTFTLRITQDVDLGPPWIENDGHGAVSDWTTRDKRAGEIVLAQDGRHRRYYDFAEACRRARTEGWDAKPFNTGGRETPRQQAAKAARADFERMRAWANGDWCWVGVVVTCDDLPGYEESLWGIESDAGDYLREVAEDLAAEIIARAAADVNRAIA